jgi:glycosyltransferase involved in cell wall biosynthesis
MKLLFLTIASIKEISERGIYTDLIRKFRDEGHEVCVACPSERRYNQPTSCSNNEGVKVLNIWTLNVQKTILIEKGVCTLVLDLQFQSGVKKYFHDIKFDLVLYSTPPVTFSQTIEFIKNRDGALSYLLLKDIFPQNAVDMGMISKINPIYQYFRNKEKKLYATSDFIGCLSPANVDYLLKHNPEINPAIVEVNPNTIHPIVKGLSSEEKVEVRNKYNIPSDSIVFMYGGNIGKPQGIDFIMQVLSANIGIEKVFIIVVGSGTEIVRLCNWHKKMMPKNILVMEALPKDEYDELAMACDIGLIFLDRRFTIPNFPSRLLSYLENKMPVLAATDVNTDIGKIISDVGCGFWIESGDLDGFNRELQRYINHPNIITRMGEKGYNFLKENYTTDISYERIVSKIS